MSYHPNRFLSVADGPAWMTMGERVVLYALIVGLRPSRVLEIGTYRGGSTLIMCAALDDLQKGTLICVDPKPQVAPEHLAAIAHRASILAGPSPQALGAAAEAAGGPFDLAFIDGDHTFDGLVRDIEGVLPTLAESAHLLLHDAHYYEVERAIDFCLARHPEELRDAGLVSVEVTPHDEPVERGREINWGGMRLLLYGRQANRPKGAAGLDKGGEGDSAVRSVDPGPLAMSVARGLSRAATRFPRTAEVARTAAKLAMRSKGRFHS